MDEDLPPSYEEALATKRNEDEGFLFRHLMAFQRRLRTRTRKFH